MLLFLRPILPEIILLFGGCIVLLLDVFKKHIHYLNVILVGILITSIMVISYFSNDGLFYHHMFWVSTFTQLIKILLLAFTLFYFMATSKVIDKYELNKNEHHVMVLFMLIGMCLMISSNHFIVLYVGVEIQSLAAYTLAAMQRKSQFSAEAGMKYFILGSLASIVYLFGVSYIYGAVGTLYIHEFVNLHTKGIELGAMLILISFLFKFGLFPFHQWVPDIYQGAPTPSTSILATLSKIGAIAILVRLTIGVFSAAFSFVNFEFILTCVSIGSMIIGAVVPITQVYLKRLLGYSAVGHAGFIIMGLLGRNPDGAAIIISYMIVYILSLMTVFICVMSLKNKESASEENNDLLLSKLEGLAQIRPKHALLLSVCFLSMAGLPPFIGFFPKLLILQHVINQQEWLIAGVAVCTTVIGLFYYLKLVKLMYIDVPTKQSVALTVRVNKKLWMVFWPILFIHLLGIYVPILQKLHQQYIVSAAGSLFVGFNEKNYP
jgi:NADH-quinone oxidoreductase subunit N